MNKKAAVDLSVNILVIIIISIIILAAGITLLYKFISGSEDIKAQLDERTRLELEELLVDQGKRVAVALNTAIVPREENHIFGLGILNIGGLPSNSFTIEIIPTKLVTSNNEIITDPAYLDSVKGWLLYNQDPIELVENEHRSEAVLVKVPSNAQLGEHIFDLKVYNSGELYGNLQKFYVNVK